MTLANHLDSNEVALQKYEGGIKGWLIQPCKKNTDVKRNIWFSRVCEGFNSAGKPSLFLSPPEARPKKTTNNQWSVSHSPGILLGFRQRSGGKKTQAFHWFQAWALWIEDVYLKNFQNHWTQTLLLEDPIKYLIFPKNQCACITLIDVDCMHVQ